LIEQIRRTEIQSIENVLNPPQIRRAGAANDTDDFVPLLKQQFGKVRPVLTGDACDDCPFGHRVRHNFS
jgi:hypothetical protein